MTDDQRSHQRILTVKVLEAGQLLAELEVPIPATPAPPQPSPGPLHVQLVELTPTKKEIQTVPKVAAQTATLLDDQTVEFALGEITDDEGNVPINPATGVPIVYTIADLVATTTDDTILTAGVSADTNGLQVTATGALGTATAQITGNAVGDDGSTTPIVGLVICTFGTSPPAVVALAEGAPAHE